MILGEKPVSFRELTRCAISLHPLWEKAHGKGVGDSRGSDSLFRNSRRFSNLRQGWTYSQARQSACITTAWRML